MFVLDETPIEKTCRLASWRGIRDPRRPFPVPRIGMIVIEHRIYQIYNILVWRGQNPSHQTRSDTCPKRRQAVGID